MKPFSASKFLPFSPKTAQSYANDDKKKNRDPFQTHLFLVPNQISGKDTYSRIQKKSVMFMSSLSITSFGLRSL